MSAILQTFGKFICLKGVLDVTCLKPWYWPRKERLSLISSYSYYYLFFLLNYWVVKVVSTCLKIRVQHKGYGFWGSSSSRIMCGCKEEWDCALCWKMTPCSEWFHTYPPTAPRTLRGKTHPLTCKRRETGKSMPAHSIISQLTRQLFPLFPFVETGLFKVLLCM